jgi:transposase-like protein
VPSPAIEAGTSASCQLLAERGISIDHSTTHRWVVHFSPLLLKRFGSTD